MFGPIINRASVALDLPVENVLSEQDRIELVERFSEKEVKVAIFNMKHNKAPGPDGFPIEFYQKFWSLISKDIMDLFNDFYSGALDLARFNYGVVTLLPKVADANCLQQYRPICMLNVIF